MAAFRDRFRQLRGLARLGFPDPGVKNCFAMGALRSSDGGYLLGVMGAQTVNAGKNLFSRPGFRTSTTSSATGSISPAMSSARWRRRPGSRPTTSRRAGLDHGAGGTAHCAGEDAARARDRRRLRARILAHLAREAQPELADIRIVRGPADFDPMMPPFVTAFLTHVWSRLGGHHEPAKLIKRLRVDDPDRFRLAAFDPADTCGLDLDKDDAKAMLADDIKRLAELQQRLYADGRWALLVVLQGMDAAGKDGVIKHVMTGSTRRAQVHPFKAPSEEELDTISCGARHAPAGARRIGIFNRSHYEEVLVVRVHPECWSGSTPAQLVGKNIWQERFQDIRDSSGISPATGGGAQILPPRLKEEQRQRLLERLEEPAKRWKFSMSDIAERKLWDEYMAAYEDMIRGDQPRVRAVVCGAGRPQMVRSPRGGARADRDLGEPRP